MNVKPPKTMEEYLYHVDNAVFEAGDLRMSAGYDEEEQQTVPMGFVTTLEAQLKDLQHRITDGSYAFADEDLSFMPLVRAYGDQIPFVELLQYINRTHRGGLAR